MSTPWNKWVPSEREPWDFVRIAHLHRRSGFMPNWSAIEQSRLAGVDATIDRLLNQVGTDEVAAFEETAAKIGDAAALSGNADRLRAWWVLRMLASPRPLVERMTLHWHNHFATSNEKVENVPLMYEQNQILRKHALGEFAALLRAVVKHPAMLIWLDASNNHKSHPNQNLARELMELFTLGEGNYTESDVVQAARCLTGWSVRNGRLAVIPQAHDDGEKTIKGHVGNMDGDALMDLLLAQPETASRIAGRLIELFLGEGVVEHEARRSLESELRQNQLHIGKTVEMILRSQLFFSDANIRSRIGSPVEYAIGLLRMLELDDNPPSTVRVAHVLRELGQDLFHPPTVFGWPDGRDWIHTGALLGRYRFANDVVSNNLFPAESPGLDLAELPRKYGFTTAKEMEQFYRVLCHGPAPEPIFQREITENTTSDEPLRNIVLRTLIAPKTMLV